MRKLAKCIFILGIMCNETRAKIILGSHRDASLTNVLDTKAWGSWLKQSQASGGSGETLWAPEHPERAERSLRQESYAMVEKI